MGRSEIVWLRMLLFISKCFHRESNTRPPFPLSPCVHLGVAVWIVFIRPVDKCFPCVDLCRLAALHPHFAEMLALGEAEGSGSAGGGLFKAVADKLAEGNNLVRKNFVKQKIP